MRESCEALAYRFLSFLKHDAHLAPRTFREYSAALKRFVRYVSAQKKNLHEISRDDLRSFLNMLKEMQYASSTAYVNILVVKKFYRFIHQHSGYEDISQELTPPVLKKYPTLNAATVQKALAYAVAHMKIRDMLMVYLHLECRVPLERISAFTLEDVDFERAALFDSERIMTLLFPKMWADRLRSYKESFLQNSPFLFYGMNNGEPFMLTPQAIKKVIKTALKSARDQSNLPIVEFFPAEQKEISHRITTVHLKKLYEKGHPRSA